MNKYRVVHKTAGVEQPVVVEGDEMTVDEHWLRVTKGADEAVLFIPIGNVVRAELVTDGK